MRHTTTWLALLGLAALPLCGETLDEVIEKHIAARGGRPAWEAIQTLELRGNYTSFSKTEPFVWQRARGHKMRFDSAMTGHPFTLACDGQAYWMLHEFYEIEWPARMFDQDRIHERQDNELATPLFDYAADGSTAELLGPTEVDGSAAIGIKLTRADGQEETWYLDPKTYLEVARDSEGSNFGNPAPRRTFYDDFREVSGVKIPFFTESEFYTRHRIHEVTEALVNQTIDDAEFAFPSPTGMGTLAALAGEWTVKVEERSSPRQPWKESERSVTIEPLARGALLEERFTGSDGTQVVRTLSYDQFRKVYRLAQIDDFSSYLDVQEGQFDDTGKLTLSNLETDSSWTGFGITFNERTSVSEISDDGFKIEQESSRDAGESWNTATRLTYARPGVSDKAPQEPFCGPR